MLIVIGGLPGTGKTTLSRGLARAIGGVHVRIDSLEQALLRVRGGTRYVGIEGYATAYAVTEDNLRLGLSVVVDCVNPVGATRDAWHDIGQRTGVPVIEVEAVCSDRIKHQRRVETRQADIAGHALPTWQDVLAHEYEPWTRERVVIDTSRQTVAQALAALTELAASKRR